MRPEALRLGSRHDGAGAAAGLEHLGGAGSPDAECRQGTHHGHGDGLGRVEGRERARPGGGILLVRKELPEVVVDLRPLGTAREVLQEGVRLAAPARVRGHGGSLGWGGAAILGLDRPQRADGVDVGAGAGEGALRC